MKARAHIRRHGFRLTTLLAALLLASTVPTELFATAGSGQPSNETVYYDSYPAGAAPFTTMGTPWDHKSITYFFQTGPGETTPDLSLAAQQQAIRDALAEWARNSALTFTEVFTAGASDIKFKWAGGVFVPHDEGGPECVPASFDGPGTTLAHAYGPGAPMPPPCFGDVHFDEGETWTNLFRGDGAQPIDLQTVALHEVGHSLGLGHSAVGTAVMAPTYTGSHRTLDPDDTAGIQSLYGGPSGFIASLTTSATSVTVGTAVTVTATSNSDVAATPHFITVLENGAVVASCKTGTTCIFTANSATATTRTYQGRIGAADGTNTQAASVVIPVTWTATAPPPPPGPFTLTLTASATSVPAGTPVSLSAVANQSVVPTPYSITILDGATVIAACRTGTTCAASVNSPVAATKIYQARVSNADGTNSQAVSNIVNVSWSGGAATVTLTADRTVARRRTFVTLTATSSVPVQDTPYYITIVSPGGLVYQRCIFGTTCSISVTSRRPGGATFIGQLSTSDGSQFVAESAPITVTWTRR